MEIFLNKPTKYERKRLAIISKNTMYTPNAIWRCYFPFKFHWRFVYEAALKNNGLSLEHNLTSVVLGITSVR